MVEHDEALEHPIHRTDADSDRKKLILQSASTCLKNLHTHTYIILLCMYTYSCLITISVTLTM